MSNEPHALVPFAREISTDWPSRAITTRNNPDTVTRVVDGGKLAELIADEMNPERAVYQSITSTFYVRTTDSGTAHVVCLHDGRAWYGTAGGYGCDRIAAASAGMPIGRGLVATDHCGLDRLDLTGTDLDGLRDIVIGRALPRGLFTL